MKENCSEYVKYFCLFWMIIAPSLAYSQEKASDLIKVNDQTQKECVEYYSSGGVLYCSTRALSPNPPAETINYETQNITFDQRYWKRAWGKKDKTIVTVEYIPMNDDINNWQELVTSQYFPSIPKNVTPRQFSEGFIEKLKSLGFAPVVTYHQSTPDRVIFEWQIAKPEAQIQDELQMIKKEKKGFYILHYAVKKFDMGKSERDKWIANFSKSTVK